MRSYKLYRASNDLKKLYDVLQRLHENSPNDIGISANLARLGLNIDQNTKTSAGVGQASIRSRAGRCELRGHLRLLALCSGSDDGRTRRHSKIAAGNACVNRTTRFTPPSCCSTSIKPTPPRNTFKRQNAVRFTPKKNVCSKTNVTKVSGASPSPAPGASANAGVHREAGNVSDHLRPRRPSPTPTPSATPRRRKIEPQSLYGSTMSRPAIATPSGRKV